MIRLIALALLLAAPSARAYVTSATLEFCADDEVAFYLNGSVFLARSEFGPFDYQVLSTADGTLPLELFKENEENLFAVENFDTEAGAMNVSYRLTVYHSDGDPVVIWSDPEQSKFLHLAKEEKSPPGWTEMSFDDSKWTQAFGLNLTTDYGDSARLDEPAFSGLFGGGVVPYLAHRANSMCRGGDHNLFRSKFRFPNHPSKVSVGITPLHAVYGQQLGVRLVPGPDTTDISQFNLMAWLPKNVELSNYAPGASYDANLRRISWKVGNRDMKLSYLRLNAEKVLASGGWGAPEKALGPFKTGKDRRQRNIPDAVYTNAAVATQGGEAWFKIETPKVDFSQGTPVIQGVMFHSQMKMGGYNAKGRAETDRMMFNYSVNGSNEGALKSDVNVARTSWHKNWFDGYYHASEDRKWSWDDLKNLRVMIKGQQIAQRDKNLVASIACTVRYYYPNRVAPWFQAKVLEKACGEVTLQTGVFRYGSKMVSSDPLVVKVNESLCAPTPAPTLTNTPVPILVARPQPTSTPVPSGGMQAGAATGLGCLSVSPDPVDYGGAFFSFCLKNAASISVTIYNADTGGQGVRRIAASEFRAGQLNQIFFNGLGDNGKLLPSGAYICEVRAEKNGHAELRNTTFRMVKKRAKR